MTLRARTLGVTCALVAVVGCGSEPEDRAGGAVVATTTIWADITSETLCGVDVPAIIPAGTDPHTFEPSLQDRRLIENSEFVVVNGGGLEEGVIDLVADSPADAVDVVASVTTTDDDPHVWQDPTLVMEAVGAIAAASERPPSELCADEYRASLSALDAEIREILVPLAPADRVIVTSHDALGYFANRYDLEVVGTVIPSTSTLAATNASDLAALADLIEDRGVRAIFTEQLESTADADALAERLGVQVVPLVTDALTDDPDTDTYLEMMRSNARAIALAATP